jgi:hypothetical protein
MTAAIEVFGLWWAQLAPWVRWSVAGSVPISSLLAWMLLTWRGRQFALWIDQGLNVLFGSGYCDETLSAYFHRRADWREKAVNLLFFWQKDEFGQRNHCYRAWLSEFQRKHMPREYRA